MIFHSAIGPKSWNFMTESTVFFQNIIMSRNTKKTKKTKKTQKTNN